MTGNSPDSTLKIAASLPMSMTAAGFVYLAAAILMAGAGAGH